MRSINTRMDDISQEQITRLNEEIAKLTGNFSAYGRQQQQAANQSRSNAKKQLESMMSNARRYDHAMSRSIQNVEDYTRSFETAVTQLSNVFVGGAIVGAMVQRMSQLTKTYQSLTEIGQSFGGSMFQMIQRAGEAGLSLDDFASISKEHNVTITSTNGAYWQMQKQLRRNIAANGLYGMTVEQLNEFMLGHMEVSRRNGSAESKSSTQVVNEMADLALTTTALATASDKTRMEIAKLADEAMSSALSIAQIKNTPEAIRGTVDKSVREATAGFAAMQGEAGSFFSTFFNETLGSMSSLTSGGQTMIDAGMGGLASEMDGLAMKFKSGQGTLEDQINMQNSFKKQVEANLPMLQAQAAAGNDSAAQLIKMASAVKFTTAAEIEKSKEEAKNKDRFTALFSSIESVFADLKGTFISNFLKSFNEAFKGFGKITETPAYEALIKFMTEVGTQLGSWLGTALNQANLTKLANGLIDVVKGLWAFSTWLITNPVIPAVMGLLTGVAWVTGMVVGALDALNKAAGIFGVNLYKVGGVILGILGVMNMFKKLKGMVTGTMSVRAGVVNVTGGAGMGGGARGRARDRIRGRGGRMGGLGNAVGGMGGIVKGVGIGMAGGLAGDYAQGKADEMKDGIGKTAMGTLGKAASWGATGAMVGSIIPGLGTLAGGLIGAGLGGASGLYDSLSSPKEPTEVEEEEKPAKAPPTEVDKSKLVLDEMQKQTEAMNRMVAVLANKIDTGNRLLQKIEISTQQL